MSLPAIPRLTRRTLLVGTSGVALLALIPSAAKPSPDAIRPWSDGTFFGDGSGWVDGTQEVRSV
jgi:hypothetical protein